jgi:hypothetical protein
VHCRQSDVSVTFQEGEFVATDCVVWALDIKDLCQATTRTRVLSTDVNDLGKEGVTVVRYYDVELNDAGDVIDEQGLRPYEKEYEPFYEVLFTGKYRTVGIFGKFKRFIMIPLSW